MHISSDPDLNIHAIEITDYAVTDIEVLEQLMPEEIERLLKLLPMVHIREAPSRVPARISWDFKGFVTPY